MQDVRKGDICVTEEGDVVVLSRVDVQSDEMDAWGRGHIFHIGTVLRSNTVSVGSRYSGKAIRVVCHASDLLKLAESAGYDLSTPGEKPNSELTEIQLLNKKIAQLEQLVRQNPATSAL
jgi:hypothetical protein